MVALALSTELRAASGALASFAGSLVSRSSHGGDDKGSTTSAPSLSDTPPFMTVIDDLYDVSNEDHAPLYQDHDDDTHANDNDATTPGTSSQWHS